MREIRVDQHSDAIAELVSSGAIFQEVPLGEGKVDFDANFAALQESGYGGLTIEREVGDRPRGI